MSDKLEAYLEEISHFLSGRAEREEILTEIRSHITEKAAEGPGEFTDAAVEKAIAAFGPARKVAERYLDESRPIIAPAYKRFLVRYTSLLFALHAALTVLAVFLKKELVLFPLLYMPRLSFIDALMYLPAAFLTDLGAVALVLYFITQSGKDVKLPWPKFGIDLDEIKPPAKNFWLSRIATAVGAVIMLAVTDFALYLFARHQTIFFINLDWDDLRPLFTPGPGRRISLIVIAMFAVSTMALLVKLVTRSRWVDVVSNTISLALIGLILTQPLDNLFVAEIAEKLQKHPPKVASWAKNTILITLLFVALIIAVDLIKNIVIISRSRLRQANKSSVQ